MKLSIYRIALSTMVLFVMGLIPQSFAQTTLAVGTCTTFTSYTTIQQAVNAAPSGSTIDICPGVYPEQVTIRTPGLILQGVANSLGQQNSVITSPSGGVVVNAHDFDFNNFPVAAQVLVQYTFGVTLKNIVVDGAGNGLTGCGTDIMGILYQNASGTLNHVVTRNQTLDVPDYGCQDGEGIYVENQTLYGYTSTVTVKNSSVHDYQKNGITGNDAGTNMTITSNDVRGWGASPVIAQNGIQLCCGAKGTVTSNSVIDDVYTGPLYGASGILLYDTLTNGGISISGNTVGNTQFPVVLFTDGSFGSTQYGDGVSVTTNQIYGALNFDAIDLCTNGNTATGNTITNSFDSAVHLDASCTTGSHTTGNGNTVTGNTINESECAGILADSTTTGNNTTSNTFFNVNFQLTNTTSGCSFAPSSTALSAGAHRAVSPKGRTHGQAQSKLQ
jgi:hypothetical protein